MNHIINVGRHRYFWQILVDVIAAIVELGDIRRRGHDLVHHGEVLTPRTLRKYLSSHCVFVNGKKQLKQAPAPVAFAVLSQSFSGNVPVREESYEN
jgi:hypothetical protein